MKYIAWDQEKNEQLKEKRGVSFEIMASQIESGNVLAVYDHPDQTKYPGQRIFTIDFEEYVYLVHFVENEEGIFLKTIFPSRKATKQFLK